MPTSRKPSDADREKTRELAQRRKSLKVTQRNLSDRLGISAQQLGKYERGENRMPAGRLAEASLFLDELEPGSQAGRGFAETAPQLYASTTGDPREELLRAIDEARAAFNRVDEAARRLRF